MKVKNKLEEIVNSSLVRSGEPNKQILKTQKKSIEVDKVMYVNGTFDRASANDTSRTVNISFASEIPYLRWFGYEIIDMATMDFSRLNNSAILLFNHDWDDYIGVIEKAWVGQDNRAYATVRFDTHEKAEQVFQSMKAGIITQVSFGYEITKAWEVINMAGDDNDAFRVSVLPFEISFVTVAADPSVGYGRIKDLVQDKKDIEITICINDEEEDEELENCITEVIEVSTPEIIEGMAEQKGDDQEILTENEKTLENQIKIDDNKLDNGFKNQENKTISININMEKRKMEQNEINAKIKSLAKQFGANDLGMEFMDSGKTVEDFTVALLEQRKSTPSRVDQEVETFEKEDFNLGTALKQLMNGEHSGVVKEVTQEMERKYGNRRSENSIMIPFGALKRDVTVGDLSSAGNLKPTNLSMNSIEALYNNMVIVKAGASYMNDLVGDLDIPRFTNIVSAEYVAENSAAAGSDLDVDLVKLSGKDLTANIDVSRRIRKQTPYNIQALCGDQLVQAIAQKMDLDALISDGTNNSVLGILHQAGIGSIPATAMSWQAMLDLEAQVTSKNALINKGSYVTNSKMLSKMKGTQKANALNFIYENGMANEYPVLTTNGLLETGTTGSKVSPLIFGDFSQLLVGTWGALELQWNPYADSKTGLYSLTVFVTYDTVVRHPQSFAAATGIITG